MGEQVGRYEGRERRTCGNVWNIATELYGEKEPKGICTDKKYWCQTFSCKPVTDKIKKKKINLKEFQTHHLQSTVSVATREVWYPNRFDAVQ